MAASWWKPELTQAILLTNITTVFLHIIPYLQPSCLVFILILLKLYLLKSTCWTCSLVPIFVSYPGSVPFLLTMLLYVQNFYVCQTYEGHSKINLRLVGKNKRVIASKRTLSSNKELLFFLYAYPHTFSPRSVGVNTDKTWTLSSPLPPAVRCVL